MKVTLFNADGQIKPFTKIQHYARTGLADILTVFWLAISQMWKDADLVVVLKRREVACVYKHLIRKQMAAWLVGRLLSETFRSALVVCVQELCNLD